MLSKPLKYLHLSVGSVVVVFIKDGYFHGTLLQMEANMNCKLFGYFKSYINEIGIKIKFSIQDIDSRLPSDTKFNYCLIEGKNIVNIYLPSNLNYGSLKTPKFKRAVAGGGLNIVTYIPTKSPSSISARPSSTTSPRSSTSPRPSTSTGGYTRSSTTSKPHMQTGKAIKQIPIIDSTLSPYLAVENSTKNDSTDITCLRKYLDEKYFVRLGAQWKARFVKLKEAPKIFTTNKPKIIPLKPIYLKKTTRDNLKVPPIEKYVLNRRYIAPADCQPAKFDNATIPFPKNLKVDQKMQTSPYRGGEPNKLQMGENSKMLSPRSAVMPQRSPVKQDASPTNLNNIEFVEADFEHSDNIEFRPHNPIYLDRTDPNNKDNLCLTFPVTTTVRTTIPRYPQYNQLNFVYVVPMNELVSPKDGARLPAYDVLSY